MAWEEWEEPDENPTDAQIEAWAIEAMIAEADDHPTDAEIEGWEIEAQIEAAEEWQRGEEGP